MGPQGSPVKGPCLGRQRRHSYQPRATPWVYRPKTIVSAESAIHRAKGLGSGDVCSSWMDAISPMKQAVGLQRNKTARKPRALPWADINQAFGLKATDTGPRARIWVPEYFLTMGLADPNLPVRVAPGVDGLACDRNQANCRGVWVELRVAMRSWDVAHHQNKDWGSPGGCLAFRGRLQCRKISSVHPGSA